MKRVEMGKKWKINSVEDYADAMETLEENKFVARMSDDWWCEIEELEEIDKQKKDVARQLLEKGIV